MLDDIKELRTFVSIVGARSLSAAARDMNLALSVVSKRLASLERRAEARLIARSTRRLALTEEGQDLYERAQRILAEIDAAETALTSGRVEPQGLLRVSAPVAFGRAHVSPVCRDLVSAHPKISIDLRLTDRMVDLIEEGVDVVVRIGPPKDSRLVMRKLIDDYRWMWSPTCERAASSTFFPGGTVTPRPSARYFPRAVSFQAACSCLSTPWRIGSTSALVVLSRRYSALGSQPLANVAVRTHSGHEGAC
jgi:DNA-binding transcriptional LysR family regulator